MKQDIHYILIEWGKWRQCNEYWDREIKRVDVKPEPGPRIPKGVPRQQTPRIDIQSFWKLSEVYDRWASESVLRSAVKLTYLMDQEWPVRQICQAMSVSPVAYGKYISQAQGIMGGVVQKYESNQSF